MPSAPSSRSYSTSSHALEHIATNEDGHGAPAEDVLDTLAREYGADRAMTALLDLLVQGECY
jgi:hypothetical protein